MKNNWELETRIGVWVAIALGGLICFRLALSILEAITRLLTDANSLLSILILAMVGVMIWKWYKNKDNIPPTL